MSALATTNLVARFLLELAALAALAWCGADTGHGAVSVLLAVGAPLVAATVWGLLVAPRRRHEISRAARFALQALVFGASAAWLLAIDRPALAVALAAGAALNGALLLSPGGRRHSRWSSPHVG
jgi:Protein of unknown function (DUF2568)